MQHSILTVEPTIFVLVGEGRRDARFWFRLKDFYTWYSSCWNYNCQVKANIIEKQALILNRNHFDSSNTGVNVYEYASFNN